MINSQFSLVRFSSVALTMGAFLLATYSLPEQKRKCWRPKQSSKAEGGQNKKSCLVEEHTDNIVESVLLRSKHLE